MKPTRFFSCCSALIAILLLSLWAAPSSHSQKRQNVEAQINALLAKMTLAEKLGQLQQLDGEANGNFRPEHLEMARKGLLGSTLNVRGAQKTNELQRIAVSESRLKIPLIFGFDVIHGYRTIFPIPLGEAASWDPAAKLQKEIATQHVNRSSCSNNNEKLSLISERIKLHRNVRPEKLRSSHRVNA